MTARGSVLVAAFLAACSTLAGGPETVVRQAQDRGFSALAELSPLFGMLRQTGEASNLTVYIEGDGAPWQGGRPPRDPTPVDPLALRLAQSDAGKAVAYLGRPCQYLDADSRRSCSPALWTNERFSETALIMISRAIDQLQRRSGATRINLVGYSGGGVVATLLAARRRDVACLVTLAAPLDVAAWVAHHRVSPLDSSLDPADFAERLVPVKQSHFGGERDTVVPLATVRRYLDQAHAHLSIVPGYRHDCCWAENWRELRQRTCLVD